MTYHSLTAKRAGRIARRNYVEPSMEEDIVAAVIIAAIIIGCSITTLSIIGEVVVGMR